LPQNIYRQSKKLRFELLRANIMMPIKAFAPKTKSFADPSPIEGLAGR